MNGKDEDLLKGLLEAFASSIDASKLRAELQRRVGGEGQVAKAPAPTTDVLRRLLLEDVLDESILGARAGEKSYPLRLFFSQLSENMADEQAFALLSALNFYFRVEMDEEIQMRVGIETSRLYYRFASATKLAVPAAPPSTLIAALMSTQLARVRFESVDGATVFDSALHERGPEADAGSSTIKAPLSFLARVAGNNLVRVKASVRT